MAAGGDIAAGLLGGALAAAVVCVCLRGRHACVNEKQNTAPLLLGRVMYKPCLHECAGTAIHKHKLDAATDLLLHAAVFEFARMWPMVDMAA